jgi:hypothetical protein
MGYRNNTSNENGMPAKFIERQPNLIIINLIKKTSFGTNSVNVSPLRKLN